MRQKGGVVGRVQLTSDLLPVESVTTECKGGLRCPDGQ